MNNSGNESSGSSATATPLIRIAAEPDAPPRSLPGDEVRQAITRFLNQANFRLAAWWATQLADQLRNQLWPQWQAAQALYLHEEADRALHYINRALAIDPDNLACLVLQSRLHLLIGEPAKAQAIIAAAIRLSSEDSKLHGIQAEMHVEAGDLQSAAGGFIHALEIDATNTDAMLGLARLPGNQIPESQLESISETLAAGRLTGDNQIKAHFALALIYAAKGNTEQQFSHLTTGNALKNATLDYDQAASARECRALVEFFSAEYFQRHRDISTNPEKIIFIVGFPRCGSTLIEQILSSHPQVTGAGETQALRHALRDLEVTTRPEQGFPYWLNNCSAETCARIAALYRMNLSGVGSAQIITDKLLDNYKFIGIIHLIFPQAKIIHVQRNPADACFSCYQRLFELGNLPYTYSLEDLASRYRDYRELMRHWADVLPGRIHTIDYENLVQDQAGTTRALLDHCTLPWDDACLEFHKAARTVRTSSSAQVRQPIYTNALGSSRQYDQYLGPLLDLTNE